MLTKETIREQIEWSDFWWGNEPDNSKPRVLFIGNSISRGYYPFVSENLSEEFNCDRLATSRSIADPALIKETKIAMGKYNHCIIHFNNGLHGWHLDDRAYEAGMRKYVKFLKSHKAKGCKIVYSLTTPVPSKEEGVKLDTDRNGVVLERNRIAMKIMEENNIPVIDLYGLMEPEIEKYSASKGNLHYNKKGYERLATRISGEIARIGGINTAIVPVPEIEKDGAYDWWTRHADIMHLKDSINPEIVLIGNSITHYWGGPLLRNLKGEPRKGNGPNAWDSVFKNYRVLNLGFGWDRTQNVLWRIKNGELDGLRPRLVIIHIGTNNTSQTKNAYSNTAEEITEAVHLICEKVHEKLPDAKILLMSIMPREEKPDHPRRLLINETNQLIKELAAEPYITLMDISSEMLTSDGILTKEIAKDRCHPTEKGYQIWADKLRYYIEK